MRRLLPAIAAAGAITVAPSAAGAAPTIDVDYPCYTPGMAQQVTGGGFTAGGPVELNLFLGDVSALDYQGTISTTADAAGAIAVQAATPHFDQETGLGALIAIDSTLQAQGALPEQFSYGLGFDISQWELDVASWNGSGRGKPGRRSKLTARGWVGTASTTLYAHYVRKGKLAKTVRVGNLSGSCGNFSGRMREFPFKPVKKGAYRVEFDTTRAYPNDDGSIFYRRITIARSASVAAAAALADPIARLRHGAGLLEYR